MVAPQLSQYIQLILGLDPRRLDRRAELPADIDHCLRHDTAPAVAHDIRDPVSYGI